MRCVNFFHYFIIEFSLQEMNFDISGLIFFFCLDFVSVRVVFFFHFVGLSDVLEFVGLEEVHHLFAYSAGSGNFTFVGH